MARHLKQITDPVSGYLKKRFSLSSTAKRGGDKKELPPLLEIAFLQGEAVLRQKFFRFLINRKIEDAKSQLHFWNSFQQGADVFTQFCQASGLNDAFKQQISTDYIQMHSNEKLQYTGYCCLLWDLQQNKQSALLSSVTDQLFSHYIASIFPTQSTQKTHKELTQEIIKQLALRWQIRPEIKESYKIENDEVIFTLVAKMQGYHPVDLITLQGKRLKPTRLAANKRLLQQLEKPLSIEQPKPRIAKKSQPIKPLKSEF